MSRNVMSLMWAEVAPAWETHADEIDELTGDVLAAMLEVVSPGDRVLELACGPGGTGLRAAEVVGPGGHVVLSDVVPEMVEIALRRAAALGRTNVSGRVLDLDAIDEPDGSVDVALVRGGLMFCADHGRALAELNRVVRPGGRLAAATWSTRASSPRLGLLFEAVETVTQRVLPPPGVHGPFALDDPSALAALAAGAGWAEVAVEAVPNPATAPTFEAWFERTIALAGPLAAVFAGLDLVQRNEIEAWLRQAAAPFVDGTGLTLPGENLVLTARRAA